MILGRIKCHLASSGALGQAKYSVGDAGECSDTLIEKAMTMSTGPVVKTVGHNVSESVVYQLTGRHSTHEAYAVHDNIVQLDKLGLVDSAKVYRQQMPAKFGPFLPCTNKHSKAAIHPCIPSHTQLKIQSFDICVSSNLAIEAK